MKKLILIAVIAVTAFMFSACESSNSSNDNLSNTTTTEGVSQTTTIKDPGTGEITSKFYYNKLYEYLCNDGIYTGEISKLDRSLLEGYEFIGLTASKVEYDEIPDKNLVSSVYDKGIPVLYNKSKDDFIFWFQEDNYWVELVEWPIYEE